MNIGTGALVLLMSVLFVTTFLSTEVCALIMTGTLFGAATGARGDVLPNTK